jgi:2-C-methyl-D-erythritol 4-phosphate cytidylyltransferase/2-C-methyl-D-erythritol 2,4-cyclodiphosphate synthase
VTRTVVAGHTGVVIQQQVADVVIVAAGSSRRMGGQDKLGATIAGRPVLRWTVEAFAAAPEIDGLIVVTAPERVDELLATPWLHDLGVTVVPGGARRQDSVAAGVGHARAELVLVHDAARPLVSAAVISRVVQGVQDHGAVVPTLPVVDALKLVDEAGRISGTAERVGLFRAQTPQGARRELLLAAAEAYAGGPDEVKDEAELLARDGVSVATVAGDTMNIKVTLPEDLALARRLVEGGAGLRVTSGSDSHPFGAADGLRLGGLLFEAAPRLHGHSDGDVVLHALCDALLAASSGGDLGRLFPSGERATRGIDSRELLAEVMSRVHSAGSLVSSADVTILGARPRLGAKRLDAMAAIIAGLMHVDAERVSVKAATGNLSGDEGAGRVISASCLVSVVSR